MKNLILPVAGLLLCLQALSGQSPNPATIDSSYLASKTSYFSVENENIDGDGAKVLRQIFEESQYVVFGERHDSKQTSLLISALFPLMIENSFNTLCLEVGPHSAEKLKQLMKPHEKTVKNLKEFNSMHYYPKIDQIAIPFFTGVEDAEFLAKASAAKMDIWGLDQEFFYSMLYLPQEMLVRAKEHKDYSKLEAQEKAARQVMMDWMIKANESEDEIQLFEKLLSEPAVINYFDSISAASPKAAQMVDDLKISWDIYTRYRQDSHADRISYMRNNFKSYHDEHVQKTGTAPKVLLKFGQVHASQTLSLGTYDIGHYVDELAKADKQKCCNINSWTRYYREEDGSEIDYLEEYKDFYARYQLFIRMAKRNQWTIIDLASIREDVKDNKIALPSNGDFHKMNALIQGYDFQLILPLDEIVTYNIEEGWNE